MKEKGRQRQADISILMLMHVSENSVVMVITKLGNWESEKHDFNYNSGQTSEAHRLELIILG